MHLPMSSNWNLMTTKILHVVFFINLHIINWSRTVTKSAISFNCMSYLYSLINNKPCQAYQLGRIIMSSIHLQVNPTWLTKVYSVYAIISESYLPQQCSIFFMKIYTKNYLRPAEYYSISLPTFLPNHVSIHNKTCNSISWARPAVQ